MHARQNQRLPTAPVLATVALAATALLGFAAGEPAARQSTSQAPAIAIEGAEFRQGVESVEFVVRTVEPLTPSPAPTIAAGRICVTSDLKASQRRLHLLCITRERSAWRLTRPSGNPSSVKVHVRANTARLRISRDLAGIAPGVVSWHVDTTGPVCDVPSGCSARYPSSGSARDRVKRVEVTGCRSRGTATNSSGPTRSKRIALGFDDGPAAQTSRMLDALAAEQAHATFYMIGGQVPSNAGVVKRMVRDGHEPANHGGRNHADLSGGGGNAERVLAETNAAVRRASGFTPCTFRPPYGATSRAIVAAARAQGLSTVTWSIDPRDWSGVSTPTIVEGVVSKARPGSIVVLHDGGGNRSATVAAVPQIIKRLKRRGYRFVTVAELLGYKYKRELVG